jgi:hypothetical protein
MFRALTGSPVNLRLALTVSPSVITSFSRFANLAVGCMSALLRYFRHTFSLLTSTSILAAGNFLTHPLPSSTLSSVIVNFPEPPSPSCRVLGSGTCKVLRPELMLQVMFSECPVHDRMNDSDNGADPFGIISQIQRAHLKDGLTFASTCSSTIFPEQANIFRFLCPRSSTFARGWTVCSIGGNSILI